jgi:hypothetical protein
MPQTLPFTAAKRHTRKRVDLGCGGHYL